MRLLYTAETVEAKTSIHLCQGYIKSKFLKIGFSGMLASKPWLKAVIKNSNSKMLLYVIVELAYYCLLLIEYTKQVICDQHSR